MPSRAYTSFLRGRDDIYINFYDKCVNALSGLYLISTYQIVHDRVAEADGCQCPLGLIPHFYWWTLRNPLTRIRNVSMPSRAYTSFLLPVTVLIKSLEKFVSMPSRAYTSFLQYPFKNLGFMRFPEPVFAGIYQNILTAAVFRAC